MKKTIAIVIACLFALSFMSVSALAESDPLRIVCTTFPQYDWVCQILGDKAMGAKLTLLLDSGVDLHSYQPTAEDIIRISTCDLFVYTGGESDEWVDDVLEAAHNPNLKAISMLECVEAKEEEIIEGMQESGHEHEHDDHEHDHDHEYEHDDHDEHDHEHEHDEHDEHDHDHERHQEIEYDEHVWLSLRNARIITQAISDVLCELDAENADEYRSNTDDYIAKLTRLDEEYRAQVNNAKRDVLLFADRFPFRYLADDYSLDYYAAFAGCSAETEASFETIVFLSQKADELNLPVLLVIEGTNHSIAETVIANTKDKNQKVLTMNSIQSVTPGDAPAATTYLGIMRDNLKVLEAALN